MPNDRRHGYYASDHGWVILVWSGRNPTVQECTAAVERQKQAISTYFPRQTYVVEVGHLEAAS